MTENATMGALILSVILGAGVALWSKNLGKGMVAFVAFLMLLVLLCSIRIIN